MHNCNNIMVKKKMYGLKKLSKKRKDLQLHGTKLTYGSRLLRPSCERQGAGNGEKIWYINVDNIDNID